MILKSCSISCEMADGAIQLYPCRYPREMLMLGIKSTAQAKERMTGISLGSPPSSSEAPNIMIKAAITPVAIETYIPV